LAQSGTSGLGFSLWQASDQPTAIAGFLKFSGRKFVCGFLFAVL
jgi:hypothetical protein